MKKLILVYFLFLHFVSLAQNSKIEIIAKLDTKKHFLKIQQKIVYYNTSKDNLSKIYLHNWANSYINPKSPLGKRLLEDYNKSLYFSKKEERGYSKILALKGKNITTYTEIRTDILKIGLKKELRPNDSVTFLINYTVKIPKSKFTAYGRDKNNYNLRYWYLTPVVYENNWQTMSNYNIDDLYAEPIDFKIKFTIPKEYILNTDLDLQTTKLNTAKKTIVISGKNRVDIELNISKNNKFKKHKASSIEVISNINLKKSKEKNTTNIIKRQLNFIAKNLGKYPFKKIYINKIIYKKNPVYGLNQLPKLFNAFNNKFLFEIKMLKALTNKYINNTVITNRRKDTWLNDAIQNYLIIKYMEEYHPKTKAIGKISKIWGIKNYQIAKINFNEKYPFVYQFAANKHLDQSLKTSADSLSTFNRKIINKYKAGLGLQYLDKYIKNNVVQKSITQFYTNNLFKKSSSNSFKKIINSKTNKDLNWFFGDYIQTDKKIDYSIKKVTKTKDSIKVAIKNNSDITVPILVYGIKNKKIKYKEWFNHITQKKTIAIAKNNFDKIALNYEYIYPEINLKNNWKNTDTKLLNRPIQFRFFKDIENPYYNQIFYNINGNYNFYDGIIIGPSIYNKSMFSKKWLYAINPTYGTRSQKITGSLSLQYEHYFKNSKFRRIKAGLFASNFHYAPNLSYNRISSTVNLFFKRKSLRELGGKFITARYLIINKEIEQDATFSESNNYNVFTLKFSSIKPEVVHDFRYNLDFQLAKKFSKVSTTFSYKKLTTNRRQFSFRVYAGSFLFNKTGSDFFDFSINRPSDYLFDYNYLGRSEDSGFFSQQFTNAEGGFKSIFNNNLANQWMITSNNSISLWRWLEIYGDVGFFKNKNNDANFKYDSGVRLNFIHNFLEIYLPVQSSNGFEIEQTQYSKKIRYVFTINPAKIYNFIKRGFY